MPSIKPQNQPELPIHNEHSNPLPVSAAVNITEMSHSVVDLMAEISIHQIRNPTVRKIAGFQAGKILFLTQFGMEYSQHSAVRHPSAWRETLTSVGVDWGIESAAMSINPCLGFPSLTIDALATPAQMYLQVERERNEFWSKVKNQTVKEESFLALCDGYYFYTCDSPHACAQDLAFAIVGIAKMKARLKDTVSSWFSRSNNKNVIPAWSFENQAPSTSPTPAILMDDLRAEQYFIPPFLLLPSSQFFPNLDASNFSIDKINAPLQFAASHSLRNLILSTENMMIESLSKSVAEFGAEFSVPQPKGVEKNETRAESKSATKVRNSPPILSHYVDISTPKYHETKSKPPLLTDVKFGIGAGGIGLLATLNGTGVMSLTFNGGMLWSATINFGAGFLPALGFATGVGAVFTGGVLLTQFLYKNHLKRIDDKLNNNAQKSFKEFNEYYLQAKTLATRECSSAKDLERLIQDAKSLISKIGTRIYSGEYTRYNSAIHHGNLAAEKNQIEGIQDLKALQDDLEAYISCCEFDKSKLDFVRNNNALSSTEIISLANQLFNKGSVNKSELAKVQALSELVYEKVNMYLKEDKVNEAVTFVKNLASLSARLIPESLDPFKYTLINFMGEFNGKTKTSICDLNKKINDYNSLRESISDPLPILYQIKGIASSLVQDNAKQQKEHKDSVRESQYICREGEYKKICAAVDNQIKFHTDNTVNIDLGLSPILSDLEQLQKHLANVPNETNSENQIDESVENSKHSPESEITVDLQSLNESSVAQPISTKLSDEDIKKLQRIDGLAMCGLILFKNELEKLNPSLYKWTERFFHIHPVGLMAKLYRSEELTFNQKSLLIHGSLRFLSEFFSQEIQDLTTQSSYYCGLGEYTYGVYNLPETQTLITLIRSNNYWDAFWAIPNVVKAGDLLTYVVFYEANKYLDKQFSKGNAPEDFLGVLFEKIARNPLLYSVILLPALMEPTFITVSIATCASYILGAQSPKYQTENIIHNTLFLIREDLKTATPDQYLPLLERVKEVSIIVPESKNVLDFQNYINYLHQTTQYFSQINSQYISFFDREQWKFHVKKINYLSNGWSANDQQNLTQMSLLISETDSLTQLQKIQRDLQVKTHDYSEMINISHTLKLILRGLLAYKQNAEGVMQELKKQKGHPVNFEKYMEEITRSLSDMQTKSLEPLVHKINRLMNLPPQDLGVSKPAFKGMGFCEYNDFECDFQRHIIGLSNGKPNPTDNEFDELCNISSKLMIKETKFVDFVNYNVSRESQLSNDMATAEHLLHLTNQRISANNTWKVQTQLAVAAMKKISGNIWRSVCHPMQPQSFASRYSFFRVMPSQQAEASHCNVIKNEMEQFM